MIYDKCLLKLVSQFFLYSWGQLVQIPALYTDTMSNDIEGTGIFFNQKGEHFLGVKADEI